MRIALCISGEFRTFNNCYPTIKKNIINVYNPDIFVHTWKEAGCSGKEIEHHNKMQEQSSEHLIKSLHPVKYITEPFFDSYFDAIEGVVRPELLKKAEPTNSKGNLPLFYGMSKALELMTEYEAKIGKKYDIVVRMRPDLEVFGRVPEPSKLDKNAIYLSHYNKCSASDQFAIGSRDVMLYYSNIFNYLSSYWKVPVRGERYQDILVGERLMKYHLDSIKDIEKHVINADFIIRRFSDTKLKKIIQRLDFYARRKYHIIRKNVHGILEF